MMHARRPVMIIILTCALANRTISMVVSTDCGFIHPLSTLNVFMCYKMNGIPLLFREFPVTVSLSKAILFVHKY